MKVETLAVRNFKNETRALYLAKAGINLALGEIMSGYRIVYLDNDGNVAFAGRKAGVIKTPAGDRAVTLEQGTVKYSITDENGRLDINTSSRDMIAALLRKTGVSGSELDVIADAMLDWRDADSDYRLNGAESEYYMSLPSPYAARNGRFESVEDMLLVKGMTPAVFYGSGNVPLGGDIDIEDNTGKNAVGEDYMGIARFVTAKGGGSVNINTAAEPVLESVFGKGRTNEILARRETEGFFEQPIYGGAVTSNVFLIESTGESEKIMISVKAIAEKTAANEVKLIYWKEGEHAPH
ncbi:MAG: general secretion pathway protein GspK [Deltaproteobacteria bacterium]|nr:general secretion pathway protein GspK [Deltaproteobacteria bacterium]